MKNPKITLKTNKHVIYQMMFHLWGNTNTTNKPNGSASENGVTKFENINDTALQTLKKFGYTHLYLTGILEHATTEDFSSIGIRTDNPSIVKGRCGAPFAVKDYYDVNPFFAKNPKNRMAEFEEMVKRIKKNGLKVIIDFVPNHVARDYYSDAKPDNILDFGAQDDTTQAFSPQNNFYYIKGKSLVLPKGINQDLKPKPFVESPAKATGNDVFSEHPSQNDWFETVKLNYGVDYQNNRTPSFYPTPNTWTKMLAILMFWADKGIDGFRCDMAEMVPVEFWEYATSQVREVHPNCIFIAEIYSPHLYGTYSTQGGFDYLYDKVGLYDALRRLVENKAQGTVEDITRVWQQESGDFSAKMLRFLENHDEHRIASDFFAKDPFKAIPAMTLAATLHDGPLMIYFGQEIGEKGMEKEGFGQADGRTTMFDFWGVQEHIKWMNNGKYDGGLLDSKSKELLGFYRKLLKLVQNNAIKHGSFFDLQYLQDPNEYNTKKIYSYVRAFEKEIFLFVYNFDQKKSYHFSVNIPSNVFEIATQNKPKNYVLKDVFLQSLTTKYILGQGKIPITIPENTVLVLKFQP